MNVEVKAKFELFGVLKRKGKWYIAHCPPLDVTTQGRTTSEAKSNLREACEMFLISCFERGTIDQAFRELGFVPTRRAAREYKAKGQIFEMQIPIPFGLEKAAQWHA
jgi:predicted RNase H-like HicB family nuclease